MLFAFFSLCLSEGRVIEIGDYDYIDYIGKDKPAFVKFYNPTCPHCFAMSDEFWQASEMFIDKINFCAIDCIAHRELCQNKFGVEKYPNVAFFEQKSLSPIIYENPMTADDFADFLEKRTQIKPVKIPKLMYEINPSNFETWKHSKKCAFAVYYSSLFPHHKRFLYEARVAADIYNEEENVTIGIIRCDKYRELCLKVHDNGYPVATRYTDGKETPFTDMALINFVVSDINDNCGTHRKLDGTLEDDIGVIKEAEPYVKEFLEGDEAQKNAAIESVKKINGASFYVKAMERIKKEGTDKIKALMAKMEQNTLNKTLSKKNRDVIKKNLNVFKVFFPPPPKPTATPMPKPTLVPNPAKGEKKKNEKKHPHQQPQRRQQQVRQEKAPVEYDDL